jgi:hypothetical protein
MLFLTLGIGIAFFPREYTRQELHSYGVRVLLREKWKIAPSPRPEDQARRFNHDTGADSVGC